MNNPRLAIDFRGPGDTAGAMRSLDQTAMELLREADSGLDRGDATRDRLERLERMVSLLILRSHE